MTRLDLMALPRTVWSERLMTERELVVAVPQPIAVFTGPFRTRVVAVDGAGDR